ncbi:MAG: hypothetical protein HGA75_19350, partial [Thiobacillus sp.]|nr:hypothetical protein [Thiobacillus sp.]
REEPLEVGRRPVATHSRDSVAEGVGQRPPVEKRDRVTGGEETPRELVAEESRPADEEDLRAFSERAEEATVTYETLLASLKRDGKL